MWMPRKMSGRAISMIERSIVAISTPSVVFDKTTRLERAERRAHRLRADLLEPGERARRGRAGAVQAREGRGLRHRELVFGLRLTQPPLEQANAHLKRSGDVVDIRVLRHILKANLIRLTLQVDPDKVGLASGLDWPHISAVTGTVRARRPVTARSGCRDARGRSCGKQP